MGVPCVSTRLTWRSSILVRGRYETNLPFIVVGSWDFHILFLVSIHYSSLIHLLNIHSQTVNRQ